MFSVLKKIYSNSKPFSAHLLKIINRIIIHVHCINLNKFDFKWNGKELLKAHDIVHDKFFATRSDISKLSWVDERYEKKKSHNFQYTSNALDGVRKTRIYLASMNILKSKDIFCVHVQCASIKASSIEYRVTFFYRINYHLRMKNN